MRISKAEALKGANIAGKARKIANNTFKYMRPGGAEVIRLHRTDIIIKQPDGRTVLNTGGWQTATTKDRINALSGFRVYSDRGQWIVSDGAGTRIPFHDGMTLPDDFNTPTAALAERTREHRRLARDISKFVAGIDKLESLPMPDASDCWYCAMFQAENPRQRGCQHVGVAREQGQSENNQDYSHLREHIAENYLHGSLIVNAMRWAGYQDRQIGMYLHAIGPRRAVKSALRRYLRRKLGLPA